MSEKLYTDSFAYDLSKNALTKGDVYDFDVINQSIENILSTYFGERLFNPYFGSTLGKQLFQAMDSKLLNGDAILKTLIDEILIWEDRVVFIDSMSRVTASPDNNSIVLELTYALKKTGIRNTFKRKIRLP
jgi:phage baseplate assembly protein W